MAAARCWNVIRAARCVALLQSTPTTHPHTYYILFIPVAMTLKTVICMTAAVTDGMSWSRASVSMLLTSIPFLTAPGVVYNSHKMRFKIMSKTSDGVCMRNVLPWGRREITFSLTYAQTAPWFRKRPFIIAAPSASLRIRDVGLLWSVCLHARSFATLSPFATASAWTSIPLCGCTWILKARPREMLELGRKVPSSV